MQRFVAAWAGWPRSRVCATLIPASLPLFAAVIPTKRPPRILAIRIPRGITETVYPARSIGCIATRLYDLEKRAGVRPLALAQLFQRGNDRVRSALDVAEEIRHSLP